MSQCPQNSHNGKHIEVLCPMCGKIIFECDCISVEKMRLLIKCDECHKDLWKPIIRTHRRFK